MKIFLYIIILISKILENTLSTIRLIVVANGKKTLGAILNFIVSIIWIFTASIVIININEDLIKVFFFCLGSGIGSYFGSYIENKIALGNNLITCIIEKEELPIIDILRNKGYAITTIPGYGKDNEKYILLISIPRKKRKKIIEEIEKLSKNPVIISQNIVPIYGGYTNL